MPLYIHELIHLFLSILAGLIIYSFYSVYGVPLVWLLIIACIGGVVIDVDHGIDYFFAYGWSFNLKKFLKGREFDINKKIYVLFHGYEYCAILFFIGIVSPDITIKSFLLTLGLSSLFHLLADVKLNHVLFKTYSITFRILNNFEIKKIT